MSGFGARLRCAMVMVDLSPADLARRLKKPKKTIYAWLASDEPPTVEPELIWDLADSVKTAARYLFTGKGSPLQRPGILPDEALVLERLQRVPAADRINIINLLTRPYA